MGTEGNSDSQDDSLRLRSGHIQRVSFHLGGDRRRLPQQIRTYRSTQRCIGPRSRRRGPGYPRIEGLGQTSAPRCYR